MRPPTPYHCPRCLTSFPDIWALKRHQEETVNCDDRPTRAEAEADARDDRTQLERVLDLQAWHSEAGGKYAVHVGYPTRQSFIVDSIEVARAVVTILNLSDPSELELITTSLLRAYGEKCVALEHYVPELDDTDPPDWEDTDHPF